MSDSEKTECVDCGSENIIIIGHAIGLRPNGARMKLYKCLDCGTEWEE